MYSITYAFYLPRGSESPTIEYTKEDLSNPSTVKTLFDYCQILEGYITYSGWLLLLKLYDYSGLYEIDKESGWFSAESLESFIKDVDLEIRMTKASEYDTCCRDYDL